MIADAPVIDFHGHVGNWEPIGMLDEPMRKIGRASCRERV